MSLRLQQPLALRALRVQVHRLVGLASCPTTLLAIVTAIFAVVDKGSLPGASQVFSNEDMHCCTALPRPGRIEWATRRFTGR